MACLFIPFASIVLLSMVYALVCLEIKWIVWSDYNPSVTVIS